MLDIAKIESGKMEIDPGALDPRGVIDNALRRGRPQRGARRASIFRSHAPAGCAEV